MYRTASCENCLGGEANNLRQNYSANVIYAHKSELYNIKE